MSFEGDAFWDTPSWIKNHPWVNLVSSRKGGREAQVWTPEKNVLGYA